MVTISGYSVEAALRESAGVVLYRARAQSDGAPVLLKVLGDQGGPRALAQLKHEHALLSALDLPGQRALALTRCEGHWAMITEDPGGRPLKELAASGPVDVELAIRIGLALSALIERIHQRGVIHKDIRPETLLWNAALERASPLDLGVATQLGEEPARLVSPEALEGDIAYISPEQTGRMNRSIDARTDLYSIGITLYALLTGGVPFQGEGALGVLHGHIARVPPSPREAREEVPAALSDIIMKLLAKSAEERYQSGRGLFADLEECLRRWRGAGDLAPFPLGRCDHSAELRIPQRLYGRTREVALLFAAWGRARRGAAELLLIAGSSGIGKSRLVNEIHKPIATEGGHFIAGKFDQLTRSVPFAPIACAFGALLRRVLSSDERTLRRYKEQLEAALGANAGLLIDLCPELGLLLGPQPSVPALGPIEAQNRFTLTFQRFLRVFTSAEHPLVLFLDDLQWADSASLRVLLQILTDPESSHLLVIGAYRDNEVDAAHPLTLARHELRAKGATVMTLTLAPLDAADVNALVADALRRDLRDASPLSALIYRKTQGNPLFIGQFLAALHRDGLLTFDPATGSFAWDMARAEQQMVAASVIELMNRKLRDLTPGAQRLLGLAAGIGHEFEMKTLTIISEQPRADVAAQLWEALRAGVLVPLSVDYRLMPLYAEADPSAPLPEDAVPMRARFLHDRVQEAAYALIPRDQEEATHLRIGRLLWARPLSDLDAGAVFDVVNHMNRAIARITDPEERLALSRLNLDAGRRAKARSAYPAALDYLRAGVALLEPEPFARAPELCFALTIERAECEHLSGDLSAAEALSAELLARATSTQQRAEVSSLRTVIYSAMGKYAAAVESALSGLALYGIEIPRGEAALREAMKAELEALPASLGGREIMSLAEDPIRADPDQEMIAKLLGSVGGAAHLSNPALLSLLVAKLTNLSLRSGHTSASAYAYVRFAVMLAGVYGRLEEAYQFSQLALALNERAPVAHLSCKVYFCIGLILHYKEPLRAALATQIRTRKAGLESGDLQAASFACFHTIVCRIALGEPLEAVREELEQFQALMARTSDVMTVQNLAIAARVIKNLEGKTIERRSLSGDGFEEDGLLDRIAQTGLAYPAWWYFTAKLELLFLHDDHEGAVALIPELTRRGASAIGQYLGSMLPFYASLSLAARHASVGEEEQRRYEAMIAGYQADLGRLAEACPDNYGHKWLLVKAEAARLGDRPLEAMALYDEAIAAAERAGFVSEQAVAAEVCARFYLGLGRISIGRGYLEQACALYQRWGATAKVTALRERYPHLLFREVDPPAIAGEARGRASAPPARLTSASLDMGALMRAAHAIAGEIVLEKAIEQILRIIAVTAGAQRGFLILAREDRLMLEAAIQMDPDSIEVGLQILLEEYTDLPVTLINYIARSRELVALGDAVTDATFGADPYIAARKPRSVLGLPLLYQGHLTGALYLENSAAYDAFNTERVEVARLLSAQAASALENALLYARLQAVTEQLRGSLGQLHEANERLQREFEERARAEEARAALKEEIIRVQSARLAELSSPLIPITDDIMVMPLIGVMDAERGQNVLDVALHGAQAQRARFVILDITGIKHIDMEVAASLIKTGSALRLLGVEAMLTGIKPETAGALVSAGVSLGALRTHGTLQRGIAYAMGRSSSG